MNARARAAFSLVEVTMALGLVSFCLVAMMGMLPVGLMQERESAERIAAMQIMSAVEGDFQNFPAGATQTDRYEISTGVGSQDSFYVDSALGLTQQQANAEYSVKYEVRGTSGNMDDRRVYLLVSRARPGEDASLKSVVAEGIIQKRVN